MSEGFSDPIIGGGGTLVYPSIHSPDFVTGVSGWTINKDGSAEFDNLTIRGTFMGLDFEISSAGIFFYNGAPAKGTLVFALTTQTGTDAYGNNYQPLINAGIWSASTGDMLNRFGIDLAGETGWADASGNVRFVFSTTDVAFEITNSFGAFVAVLNAVGDFWTYTDTGSAVQGALSAAIAGTTGDTDPIGGNAFPAGFNGPSTAIQPRSSPPASETWHAPATTGFTTFAGTQPVEYQFDALGNVEITGVMETTGAYAAGTAIWTMPAGYRPAKAAAIMVIQDTGGALSLNQANISAAGVVSLALNVPNTTLITFCGGHYRLAA